MLRWSKVIALGLLLHDEMGIKCKIFTILLSKSCRQMSQENVYERFYHVFCFYRDRYLQIKKILNAILPCDYGTVKEYFRQEGAHLKVSIVIHCYCLE